MPVTSTNNNDTQNILPFDASTATTLPMGCRRNQRFVVSNGGTVSGVTFRRKDVFYALIDNPSGLDDFGDIMPDIAIDHTDTDFELVFLTALL